MRHLLVELTVVLKDETVSTATGDDWARAPVVVMATVVLTVVDVVPVNGGSSSMSSQNSPARPYLHSHLNAPCCVTQRIAPSEHGLSK